MLLPHKGSLNVLGQPLSWEVRGEGIHLQLCCPRTAWLLASAGCSNRTLAVQECLEWPFENIDLPYLRPFPPTEASPTPHFSFPPAVWVEGFFFLGSLTYIIHFYLGGGVFTFVLTPQTQSTPTIRLYLSAASHLHHLGC